jgi:hypothetical protein
MHKLLKLMSIIVFAWLLPATGQTQQEQHAVITVTEVEEYPLYTTNESAQREVHTDKGEVEILVVFFRHVKAATPLKRKPAPDLQRIFEKARQLSEKGQSQPFVGPGRWFACNQKNKDFLLFIDDAQMSARIVPANAVSEKVFLPRWMIETTDNKELIEWCKSELKK